MADTSPKAPLPRGQRIAGMLFGALFTVIGIVLLITMGDNGWRLGPAIVGVVLTALGLDAIWRSKQGRRCWLMAIGSLP